jgi:hypothetical protein
MPRQLTMRTWAAWAGVPALAGAVAALALPGTTSAASAEAAMLAVGALALLAGHTWGLLVVVSSHVPLVGRLWPALAQVHGSAGHPGDSSSAGAVAVVLVTALPAVILGTLLLPRMVRHVFPDGSPRAHSLCVTGMALLLGASLVLPAAL